MLKGWIEFESEGQGTAYQETGSSVCQHHSIQHRDFGHSEDIEMLDIVMPSDFRTELADSVDS
ncbi:MAG: hypothetical protein RLY71_4138 [Pseudomonadota bacterium]